VDIAKAGRLLQQKPAYGGNIVSVIMGATNPQLATVRSRMFEPLEPRAEATAEVEQFPLGPTSEARTRLVEALPRTGTSGLRLDGADAVVCVGTELAGPAAVAEVVGVAEQFGVPVGGTHEACESGWLPHTVELGLYGRPVAPRLLVAIGVPGEFWDVTGWVKARVVVAVNGGAAAGMDETSDVLLTGDWRDVLPAVLETAAGG
jgi:electron transfer flavoprotein alpha subunit